MLMPSVFGDNLFDDFMSFPFGRNFEKEFFGPASSSYGQNAANLMRTDVKETENSYEIDVDLPGISKDNIKVALKDGYLTITAQQNSSNDEKDKDGHYIRRERYSGSCQRSFYLGSSYTESDVKAAYRDGILRLTLPKKDAKQVETKDNYIAIEG